MPRNIVKTTHGYRVRFQVGGKRIEKCAATLKEAEQVRDLLMPAFTARREAGMSKAEYFRQAHALPPGIDYVRNIRRAPHGLIVRLDRHAEGVIYVGSFAFSKLGDRTLIRAVEARDAAEAKYPSNR